MLEVLVVVIDGRGLWTSCVVVAVPRAEPPSLTTCQTPPKLWMPSPFAWPLAVSIEKR